VRDLAREHTEEAIKTLVRVMRDSKSDQARAGAAGQILDRGWGKPAQTQMHGVWDQEMNVCVAKNSHRACQLSGGVWDEGTSTCSPKL
jgi:hypothetical protein